MFFTKQYLIPIEVVIFYKNSKKFIQNKNIWQGFKYRIIQFLYQKAQLKNNIYGKNNFLQLAFILSVFSYQTKSKFLQIQISDRNKTDLRRFKPNSCKILMNEQFNHLNLLQFKDISSRHRGDKLKFRYDRSTLIILLSLAYFLFDDQILFHSKYLVQ